MTAKARKTDPVTSHIAARRVSTFAGTQRGKLKKLVSRYPRKTYQELYKLSLKHSTGTFADAPSLMRRLGEVATPVAKRKCFFYWALVVRLDYRGLKMSIGATKTTLSKRAEIEKHTKEFLKNGGKITRIPSTTKTIDVAARVFVYSDGAAQRRG